MYGRLSSVVTLQTSYAGRPLAAGLDEADKAAARARESLLGEQVERMFGRHSYSSPMSRFSFSSESISPFSMTWNLLRTTLVGVMLGNGLLSRSSVVIEAHAAATYGAESVGQSRRRRAPLTLRFSAVGSARCT